MQIINLKLQKKIKSISEIKLLIEDYNFFKKILKNFFSIPS